MHSSSTIGPLLWRPFRPAAALIGLVAFALCGLCQAESAPASHVKAAFVYNFLKFVDWPPGSYGTGASPIVLGIVGSDPLAEALNQAAGQTAHGRPIEVRRSQGSDGLGDCHALYVASTKTGRAGEVLRNFSGKAVLTIGDAAGFIEQGGMIEFFVAEGKVRFRICLERASATGLRLHAPLLQVARVVKCTGD